MSGTRTEHGAEDRHAIALVMQRHLPVAFEDGKVMCCCADLETDPDAPIVYEGPVFHRRHVADRILDLLDALSKFRSAVGEEPT